MVTPVNVNNLQYLLQQSNYSAVETKFIIEGFKFGFPIGYDGCKQVKMNSPNLKFRRVGNRMIGDKVTLWNRVMKEVKLGRYAGPFEIIPFEYYIQSPIGLVPKDNGKDVRLIFHLSYPRNSGKSVNENIPKE